MSQVTSMMTHCERFTNFSLIDTSFDVSGKWTVEMDGMFSATSCTESHFVV